MGYGGWLGVRAGGQVIKVAAGQQSTVGEKSMTRSARSASGRYAVRNLVKGAVAGANTRNDVAAAAVILEIIYQSCPPCLRPKTIVRAVKRSGVDHR